MDEKKINTLMTEGAKLLAKSGKTTKSFAISTLIPEKWLIDEENGLDARLDGKSESIKNKLNREIAEFLEKKTKKEYSPSDADVRVVFDLSVSKNSVKIEFEPLFVFGRYKKLIPEISQSRWICSKCEGDGCFKCDWKGKFYESVEEFIGDPLKEACKAKDYSLHASGREDTDVVNLAGRPFVLELKAVKNHAPDLKKIAEKINKPKKVSVSDLRIVKRGFVEAVTESHFDKEYTAEVEFEKEVSEAENEKIAALKGVVIEQQTPKRVMHRRADLTRKRKIVELKILNRSDDGKTANVAITAEAGTYIKELINGDSGRTKPSFAGILGFGAKCKKLVVSRIYDEFLDVILGN